MDSEFLEENVMDSAGDPQSDPHRNTTVHDIHAFAESGKMRAHTYGELLETTVRKRLINARRLNGMEQIEAARLLGYQNSSALSKIESGVAKAPKDFIRKAAIVYGVSTDYLFGLSDEPERDPKTAEHMAIMRAVDTTIQNQTRALVTILLKNAADMTPMEGHLYTVLSNVKRCVEAFDKVCRKNKKFQDDVLAGSTLQRAIEDSQTAMMAAKTFMDHRSQLVMARTEAMCEGVSYPLFE